MHAKESSELSMGAGGALLGSQLAAGGSSSTGSKLPKSFQGVLLDRYQASYLPGSPPWQTATCVLRSPLQVATCLLGYFLAGSYLPAKDFSQQVAICLPRTPRQVAICLPRTPRQVDIYLPRIPPAGRQLPAKGSSVGRLHYLPAEDSLAGSTTCPPRTPWQELPASPPWKVTASLPTKEGSTAGSYLPVKEPSSEGPACLGGLLSR
ncbi:hypothetical protein PCASD_00369 [Puccinia coronata f. sp. avenae]|uniref:Uncharacterized protein n=1 Tax=Puccinia coronata f. sp. avenae TaxID=200324 RepID=A0A2N5VND0_9BASI|nr:hypothetical protein PCASD_00369 [Puccinia coronata f. sp. avenae]